MVRKTALLMVMLAWPGVVWAGSATAPVADAPVAAPPAPSGVTFGSDWTGPYVGLTLGQIDADTTTGLSDTGLKYGLHGGYRQDFGRFVLGGELEIDAADTDLGGGVAVDSMVRGKIQAGYDFGRALAYATAGIADADTSLGGDSGDFYGLGLSFRLNDRFTIGGEVLEHDFDDLGGSGTGADARTITIRGSLNF